MDMGFQIRSICLGWTNQVRAAKPFLEARRDEASREAHIPVGKDSGIRIAASIQILISIK